MGMFIPLQSIEVVDDQQYAGMTQVVNIHTKTILACEEGQYLRPDEVALVASGSQILQDCIDKNWLIVINVIDGERVPPPVTTKKKKATTPPAENSESTEEATPEAEQVEEVAPEQQEESL